MLLEAGQHWHVDALTQTRATLFSLLRQAGMLDIPAPATLPAFAQVVQTITARTSRFTFVRDFRGGEIVAKAGTHRP